MDEEELYSKLNSRIREVFDNYDEDTAADEGWALLRQKFPEEGNRRGLAWLWYAAAAVVLLCLGVWLISKPGEEKNLTAKNPKTIINTDRKDNTGTDTATVPNNPVTDRLAQATPQQPATAPLWAATAQPASPLASAAKTPKQTHTTVQAPGYLPSAGGKLPLTTSAVNGQLQNTAANKQPNLPPVLTSPVKGNSTDSVISKINKADVLANIKSPDKGDSTGRYVAVNKPAETQKQTSADALNKLLSEKTAVDAVNDKQNRKESKKAVLNIFAATYFNYAKGSDNKINVGAGFGSDFRLGKKMKLSTGIAIAQNSLNYTGGRPVYSSDGLKAAASDPASAALTQAAHNSSGANGLVSALTPMLQNYSASLIGLDVPVNLKYQFNPEKNDTYISAGLSSGTFINETYVLNYTSAQLVQKSTTHGSFNNFDFAKTLNLSFGIGYPLGKNNRLIVEPFLKYPLDGLGMQQIKFGAGGVNLKLNFIPTKK